MTKEDAINYFKRSWAIGEDDGSRYHNEVLEFTIKALEQKPILDKISIEIEQVKSIMNEEIINHNRKDLINFINGLNQSLLIIDKYNTESEEV